MPEIDPTFVLNCRAAIDVMRRAGINETLIAVVIQDVRSATLGEEFRRIQSLIQANPPIYHRHGDVGDVIKEWNPCPTT